MRIVEDLPADIALADEGGENGEIDSETPPEPPQEQEEKPPLTPPETTPSPTPSPSPSPSPNTITTTTTTTTTNGGTGRSGNAGTLGNGGQEIEPPPVSPPAQEQPRQVIASEDENAVEITEKIVVTLNPNKGTCAEETLEVLPGRPYGHLPEATRPGYTFAGWYLRQNGGSQVTADTAVATTEAHTLYAHWSQQQERTLFLDANGGRLLNSEQSRAIFPGETYGELPTPLREGYGFDGWFTAMDGGQQVQAGDVYVLDEDQTLYAHWTYDPYAYWSFVLQNTTEALYACQQVSVYMEYDEDNVTPGHSDLIAATASYNVATNLGGGYVEDEWIREKNANVLVKCISDMALAPTVYSAMSDRFPGKRVLVVPRAAEFGIDAEKLYYRIYFGKLLYPDWYQNADMAVIGSELGVSGNIYGE